MDMQPLVSVIIPTYNSEKTIKRAIDSVLTQKFRNLEIIVVDNGSDDNTLKILRTFQETIKVLTCNEKGAGVARNMGVKAAKGKFTAFLDSDDFWESTKLFEQLNDRYFESTTNMILGSYATYIGSHNIVIGTTPRTKNDSDAIESLRNYGKMPMPLSTWIMHTSFFRKLGGFDRNFRVSHDLEFLIRAINLGAILKVNRKSLAYYHLHLDSESASEYVEQYLTAKYCVKRLSLPESCTLESFIKQNCSWKSKYYREALSGRFFRKAIIFYTSSLYMKFTFHIVVALILAPRIFYKKLRDQFIMVSALRN